MRKVAAALAGLVFALAVGAAAPARAAHPTVSLERSTVRLGQRIIVRFEGWPIGPSVTAEICGNLAKRGSIDCDLVGSQGLGMRSYDRQHLVELVIRQPPAPCPCVVRAFTERQDIVVLTPLTIVGAPNTPVPVATGQQAPVAVDVRVTRASQGLIAGLRSSLGGPTPYRFTVSLRNRTSGEISGLVVRARAGHNAKDQSRTISIAAPDPLAPGATWKHTQRVTLSAPVIRGYVWTVVIGGAGPTLTGATRSSTHPYLFYALVFALIADLAWWTYRRVRRA